MIADDNERALTMDAIYDIEITAVEDGQRASQSTRWLQEWNGLSPSRDADHYWTEPLGDPAAILRDGDQFPDIDDHYPHGWVAEWVEVDA